MNTTPPTADGFTSDAVAAFTALERLQADITALLASPNLNTKTENKLLMLQQQAGALIKAIPRNVLEVQSYLHTTERMVPNQPQQNMPTLPQKPDCRRRAFPPHRHSKAQNKRATSQRSAKKPRWRYSKQGKQRCQQKARDVEIVGVTGNADR